LSITTGMTAWGLCCCAEDGRTDLTMSNAGDVVRGQAVHGDHTEQEWSQQAEGHPSRHTEALGNAQLPVMSGSL
jgi:hypothetical protein